MLGQEFLRGHKRAVGGGVWAISAGLAAHRMGLSLTWEGYCRSEYFILVVPGGVQKIIQAVINQLA